MTSGLLTGRHGIRLGESECVEQVDLVVVRVDSAAGHQQCVADPTVVGRGEHPGCEGDVGPLGDGAHGVCPGAVERFCDLAERSTAETPHHGLREHHEPAPSAAARLV